MQMVSLGVGLIPAWRQSSLSVPSSTLEPTFRSHVKFLLILLITMSFFATTALLPTMPPRPHHADHRLITAGIWTVHFGIDLAGRDSQYRMRDLIESVSRTSYHADMLMWPQRYAA